jgi:hypothetical protein
MAPTEMIIFSLYSTYKFIKYESLGPKKKKKNLAPPKLKTGSKNLKGKMATQ